MTSKYGVLYVTPPLGKFIGIAIDPYFVILVIEVGRIMKVKAHNNTRNKIKQVSCVRHNRI
jgi:hypothetical protein